MSLADHRGRRVIVYCYPAALTPGCTTQAVDFTASAGDLAEAGLDIIGISPTSRRSCCGSRRRRSSASRWSPTPTRRC
ncbi:redoxin domain-containing protein [Blastococcus brunescens]|uniref:Redoxin domain-containing protein n=1 Tax=Blastococcus brunescens TaxID=1564165 RepID=A0ABZ1B660_9ACTN|nr:redoxin domain-containing protein [Blastococcus sp. BMG 8361]WRL65191.1 redoxin domain-containing protein [Blastococcus sp. BMG 8361]